MPVNKQTLNSKKINKIHLRYMEEGSEETSLFVFESITATLTYLNTQQKMHSITEKKRSNIIKWYIAKVGTQRQKQAWYI